MSDKPPVEVEVTHYDEAWRDNVRERIESLTALMTMQCFREADARCIGQGGRLPIQPVVLFY